MRRAFTFVLGFLAATAMMFVQTGPASAVVSAATWDMSPSDSSVVLYGAGTSYVSGQDGDAVNFSQAPSFGEAVGTGSQNPGTDEFAMGVNFTSADVPTGATPNVIYKGYQSNKYGQVKITLFPTNGGIAKCRVVGTNGPIWAVVKTVNIDSGKWHTATCWRENTATGVKISLTIDGVTNTVNFDPGSITTPEPVRFGNKDLASDASDQLFGSVDEGIWVVGSGAKTKLDELRSGTVSEPVSEPATTEPAPEPAPEPPPADEPATEGPSPAAAGDEFLWNMSSSDTSVKFYGNGLVRESGPFGENVKFTQAPTFGEASGTESANPGTGEFAMAVDFTSSDVAGSASPNVMYKGFYSTKAPAQVKITLKSTSTGDIVRCRALGTVGPVWAAVSGVKVGDGKWHSATCFRQNTSSGVKIGLTVDGVTKLVAGDPGSIGNDEPVRFGNKDLFSTSDDQLFGHVDRAAWVVGPDSLTRLQALRAP